MKRLFKSISLISLLCLSFSSMAQKKGGPLAVVLHVEGNVFLTYGGKTQMLKKGQHLYDFSEIITEEGAQISFVDYHDQKYHLAGASYAVLLKKMIELKRGYLWLQSPGSGDHDSLIKTANALIQYRGGEAIASFDSYAGKSQLLVIKGDFAFSNFLQKYLKLQVHDGQFSFIHNDHENGAPRTPTPIGFSSYKSITGLFRGVDRMDKTSQGILSQWDKKMGRTLASTSKPIVEHRAADKQESAPVSSLRPRDQRISGMGKVTYRRVERERQEEMQKKLLLHHKKKLHVMNRPKPRAPFRPSYNKKSGVVVRVIGQTPLAVSEGNRAPASKEGPTNSQAHTHRPVLERSPASMQELNPQVKLKPSAFENSLVDEYKKQMRHSSEVNSLINELKAYDQDYNQSY